MNWAIKPGRNLNVLQFNQKELSRHHFYVQVNPYPKSQQNDFGSEIYNPLHKNYLPDGSGTDEHELPDVDNTDLEGNQTSQTNPLRYRPAHYVPFKVPLYDEQYSQIQQDVYNDLKKLEKPDPLYRWYYRPELQFSQYSFDAKSLIVNQIDDEGEESTTGIEIEEDGTDFGPIFDDYTDSVELLFDLLGPQLDRLPALENDREFVLSLGGEEAIATIGADGKVTFNNPDHLNRLNSEDLLSLRLYLNGDAGNILWEYQIAGFSPFWSIYPDQQPEQIRNTISVEKAVANSLGWDIGNTIAEVANTIHLIPAANADDPVIDAENAQEYYLLGGMRVKLLFSPEVSSTLGKVDYMTWRTNEGKFYIDNNPSIAALGDNQTIVNTTHDDNIIVETFFQPDDWITNFNGEITASVKYENSPIPKNYKFKLKTRLLQPKSPTPMQGADVSMLEGLLWQLGISPQKGQYGSQGARIASNRSGSGEINTKNCQGTVADDRSKFYIGWSACTNGAVSLSGMVLQFQGRNDLAENAKVGRDTLKALKRDYNSYREAAYEYKNSPILSQSHGDVSSWIDDALKIWQEGSGNRVPVTYTDDIHKKVLTLSGETGTIKSRKKLLTNWIAHESKYHWGSNNAKKSGAAYQPTSFRMNEGGDRYASLSFSQLRYEYRYGSKPCAAHKEAGLNLYSPKDNIKSFVIHTSSDHKASSSTETCLGGMYKSFGDKAFLLKHRKTIIAGQDTNDLMGYRHGSGTINPVSVTSIEDEYEGLAKAIAAYNAGPSYIADRPWAGFLKYRKSGEVKNTSSYCHACRYSIEVRNGGSAVHGLGLTHRTYIWKGDKYPATLPSGLPHPKANQDWCFAYGEKEWVEGSAWKKIKAKAFDKTPDGEIQTPVGRITCQ
jgi:hypothetical protein